ncbi:unnamed protein product [marine sediment metagenome]|uniref:Uncharacterized protein n=1 Tax=marine sediment metagenome TaxID=412755 RepID=X1FP11_9ZZZZ
MFFVAIDQDDPESEKSPQLENGYVKIANELLEAKMKIRLSAYDNQI